MGCCFKCNGCCCNSRPRVYSDDDKPKVLSPDWMKDVPDNTNISQLTIPGTHESYALYGCLACGRCQSWSIEDQLKAGIRYLDCRLRRYENTLHVFHGFIDMHETLDTILPVLKKYLVEHPSEFIIFQVQEEYDDYKTTKTTQEMWDDYTKDYKDIIINCDKSKDYKISELRGKILFLEIFKTHAGKIGGIFSVQNEWSVNWCCLTREKRRYIRQFFNRATNMENSGYIFLNHLSASSDYAMMTPKFAARHINHLPLRYHGRLGIVMMDYPGEDLMQHLINQNFPEKNNKNSENKIEQIKVNKKENDQESAKDLINEDINQEKNESDKIIPGQQIYVIHVDTRKYLNIDNNNNVYCSSEEVPLTVKFSDTTINKNSFQSDDVITLSNNNGHHVEFKVALDDCSEKKNEIGECSFLYLKIKKGNNYVEIGTHYNYKDSNKKYHCFEKNNNIKDYFQCLFQFKKQTIIPPNKFPK